MNPIGPSNLRIGKTKILTEPIYGARPTPFPSRREALTYSKLFGVLLTVATLGIDLEIARAEPARSQYANPEYTRHPGPGSRALEPSIHPTPTQEPPFRLPPVVSDRAETDSSSDTSGVPRFVLKKIHFQGNTIFTAAQLMTSAKPYIGELVSLADLEDIRLAVTRHYQSAGYPNSGALLPSQHIQDGQVRLQVVEGQLDNVRIRGNGRLDSAYIRDRLRWGLTDKPLDSKALGERFQLLLTDPLIERMQGTLRPGQKPGSGILDLNVTTANPFDLGLRFDNHRSASTGADTGRLLGNLRNLTGWGDTLALTLGHSQGAMEGSIAWTIPVSPRDTRITLYHAETRATVIEEPLNEVHIDSRSRRWVMGLNYPLWRRTTGHFTLGAKFEHGFSRTWLLGQGESLSPGVESDGSARVSVFRFTQDYSLRSPTRSFSARSTLSTGVNILDATIHDHRPDGRFVSWVGQARQAWRLKRDGQKRDDRITLRADIQWTNDSLLPLEQFAVGGANSVRGYRENQLVRDQGYIASLEYRHSLLGPGNPHDLKLVLFSDIGGGRYWDKRVPDSHLWSVGIGVRWDWKQLHAAIDWGYRLRSVPEPLDHDLQDEGVHFSLNLDLL
uniref:Hemolysin activation/secretion protein n=1 Tax=Candidatus Kentrum sp. TUN TaxID=2126343 RepID=A0A451AC85_9GAMM|nr:MAG: Hemolysin activation/secretion protein [Candidatus Kentron sp. TUN]VFK63631.1 MAG: Hemolysin activation/secretion protein [Candidatus Kentron sp. TUN]VFK64018.1 MAG: Hemolysin activation/secretion protein [Candidatus Kentron sp. TUN]